MRPGNELLKRQLYQPFISVSSSLNVYTSRTQSIPHLGVAITEPQDLQEAQSFWKRRWMVKDPKIDQRSPFVCGGFWKGILL